jgi:hypothetical protein
MRTQRDPGVEREPAHAAEHEIDRTQAMRGDYAQTGRDGRDYMDRDFAGRDRDRDYDTGRRGATVTQERERERPTAPTAAAPTAQRAGTGTAAGAAAGTGAAYGGVGRAAGIGTEASHAPAALVLLGGLWFIVSRLVFTFPMGGIGPRGVLNGIVIGAAIVLIALVRLVTPASSPWLTAVSLVLGAWMIASPWVFGYAHFGTGSRLVWSDIITGAIVVLASLFSWASGATRSARNARYGPELRAAA